MREPVAGGRNSGHAGFMSDRSEDSIVKTRERIDRMHARVLELRRAAHEYAGLMGPFRAIQEKLTIDFKESGSVKHPGDKGTAREKIICNFLTKEEYLPKRYALSAGSSHVLSSSGHISGQIDLLLYDALNAPRLFSVGEIQYFPIESTFGMIEAKSDLRDRATNYDRPVFGNPMPFADAHRSTARPGPAAPASRARGPRYRQNRSSASGRPPNCC